ncbi:B12-binding domain-containing radical SAM protein [Abyssisolibacter fermentans]|uniref:B12-binding domain-containing radical SAM protein n=1 Tax=Abyssisolibacter fermentans TaxID=1766203 RepID=UPI00083614A4|nr:radical SAM protein [Abyssisolibacter fermentans]
MRDICFIHSSSGKGADHWVIPAGICGIADILKKSNIKMVGINLALEKLLNHDFSFYDWLTKNRFEYFLIEIHWFVHLEQAFKNIDLIKKIYPSSKIIVGGLTASLFCKEIINSNNNIDFIIKGDSEEPLLDLLKKLDKGKDIYDVKNLIYKKDDKIIIYNSEYILENFKNISYGDITFMKNYKYLLYYPFPNASCKRSSYWLVNGRGCIYNCKTCDGAKEICNKYLGRSRLVKRSSEDVLEDIRNISKRFEVENINLTHDICSFGKDYYTKFLTEFSKINKVKLYNEFWQIPSTSFNNIIEEFDLGSRMHYAITAHSGNEKIRKEYGKKYTNNELIKVLEFCRKHNIEVTLFFSRNIIEETKETMLDTLKLIRKLKMMKIKTLKLVYDYIIIDPMSCIKERLSNGLMEFTKTDNDKLKFCYNDEIRKMVVNRNNRLNIIENKIVSEILEA